MIRKPDSIHSEPLGKVLLINGVSAQTHSVDLDLSKVRSFEKRQELFNILHSEHPDHYSRLYLVGFLNSVGYSLEEICALIDFEASWEDYDRTMTYCQVRSVFKPGAKDTEATTDLFLHGFEKGGTGEKTFTKVLSPVHADDQYKPKACRIGNSRITCYFKKCDLCNLKVQE